MTPGNKFIPVSEISLLAAHLSLFHPTAIHHFFLDCCFVTCLYFPSYPTIIHTLHDQSDPLNLKKSKPVTPLFKTKSYSLVYPQRYSCCLPISSKKSSNIFVSSLRAMSHSLFPFFQSFISPKNLFQILLSPIDHILIFIILIVSSNFHLRTFEWFSFHLNFKKKIFSFLYYFLNQKLISWTSIIQFMFSIKYMPSIKSVLF